MRFLDGCPAVHDSGKVGVSEHDTAEVCAAQQFRPGAGCLAAQKKKPGCGMVKVRQKSAGERGATSFSSRSWRSDFSRFEGMRVRATGFAAGCQSNQQHIRLPVRMPLRLTGDES